MQEIYLITKNGFGIKVQIEESELAKLQEQLEKGDTVASIEVM